MPRRTNALLGLTAVLAGLLAVTTPGSAQAADTTTTFTGTGFGAIPDGGTCGTPGSPRDVTFDVSGVAGQTAYVVKVSDLLLTHPYAGDVTVTLIAPGGAASAVLFSRTGSISATGGGDDSDLGGPYSFTDSAQGDWWAAATAADGGSPIPSGVYRTSEPGGAPGATGAQTYIYDDFLPVQQVNGTWTLRITDSCAGDTGSVTGAKLTLTVRDCTSEKAAVTAAEADLAKTGAALAAGQAAVTKAAADLTTAQQKSAAAQQAVGPAKAALDAAGAAVTGADKKLAKAKKSGDRAKVKKARKRLKAARATLLAAQTAYGAALSVSAAATAGVKGASEALAAAQQQVTTAQAATVAAQSALTAAEKLLDDCQTIQL
ncbi:hypothetical protein [Micromonospora sp.]|uniref:hypothetical protein n=1 Tax=Micromonospora sp. TaxID=1876 RepID=UPI003B3AA6D0